MTIICSIYTSIFISGVFLNILGWDEPHLHLPNISNSISKLNQTKNRRFILSLTFRVSVRFGSGISDI